MIVYFIVHNNLFVKNSYDDKHTVVNLSRIHLMINDCPYWKKFSSDTQFILFFVIKFEVDENVFKYLPQFRSFRIDGWESHLFVNMNDRLTLLVYENRRQTSLLVDVYCLDSEMTTCVWNMLYKVGLIDF